jgi:hypothetical protein
VAAEDLAGGEVGDGDVVLVGEREDAFAGGADAEVVRRAVGRSAGIGGRGDGRGARPN